MSPRVWTASCVARSRRGGWHASRVHGKGEILTPSPLEGYYDRLHCVLMHPSHDGVHALFQRPACTVNQTLLQLMTFFCRAHRTKATTDQCKVCSRWAPTGTTPRLPIAMACTIPCSIRVGATKTCHPSVDIWPNQRKIEGMPHAVRASHIS